MYDKGLKFGLFEISTGVEIDHGDNIISYDNCKIIASPFKDVNGKAVEQICSFFDFYDKELKIELVAETKLALEHDFHNNTYADLSSFPTRGKQIFGEYEFSHKNATIEENIIDSCVIWLKDCKVMRSGSEKVIVGTRIPIICVEYFLNSSSQDSGIILKVTFKNSDGSVFKF